VYHRLGALVELLGATRQIAAMTGEVLDKTERMDLGTDAGAEQHHLVLNKPPAP
jgi:hypothetical protein